MLYAKISTAKTVTFGPVLAADGTMSSGSLAYTDAKIFKNGTDGALNASATFTHKYEGVYALALTTSDLDAVGCYEVVLNKNPLSAAPVKITVLAANVYDWLFGTTAPSTLTQTQVTGGAYDVTNASCQVHLSAGTGTGQISLSSGAVTVGTLPATANIAITGNITGNLSGSVGSVTGNVSGSVASIGTGGIASTSFAAGAINDAAIANAAIDFATFAADCKTGTGLKANVESISANAITSGSINASALNGKGDWNVGKTGYTVSTVSDKTGYSLANASIITATFGTCDFTATMKTSLNAATPAVTVSDKTGFSLAASQHVIVDSGTVTTVTNQLTAAAIADGVWDELLSGHAVAGSAGNALSTASSGGVDPSVLADAIWDEALSGHSTAGTAGKKLADANSTTPPTASAISTQVWTDKPTIGTSTLTTSDVDARLAAFVPATGFYANQPDASIALSPEDIAAIAAGIEVSGLSEAQQAELTGIKAKTDLITSGNFTIASPVAVNGTITIYIGTDHVRATSTDLAFSNADWPDLTGGSVVYELRTLKDECHSFNGLVMGARSVTCEILKAVTATLVRGQYTFRVLGTQSVANGGKTTELVGGLAEVKYY